MHPAHQCNQPTTISVRQTTAGGGGGTGDQDHSLLSISTLQNRQTATEIRCDMPGLAGSPPQDAFPRSGRYPVTLSVDDAVGQWLAIDATVVVDDAAPLSVGGWQPRGLFRSHLFDAAQSIDPDGGGLYLGFRRMTTTADVNPNKTYETPDRNPVTLTVRDGGGNCNAQPTGSRRLCAKADVDAGADLQVAKKRGRAALTGSSFDRLTAPSILHGPFGDAAVRTETPTHIFKSPAPILLVNLTTDHGDSTRCAAHLTARSTVAEAFPAPGSVRRTRPGIRRIYQSVRSRHYGGFRDTIRPDH
jgi:hypothetical protein